eukprot:2829331-Rhodomonas_salina.2
MDCLTSARSHVQNNEQCATNDSKSVCGSLGGGCDGGGSWDDDDDGGGDDDDNDDDDKNDLDRDVADSVHASKSESRVSWMAAGVWLLLWSGR